MRSTAAERQFLASAAASDVGLRRENNEDRFHCDPSSGLFMVIDGVGGQAAGEKAAETALSMLRTRLERETGAPDERLREAITLANNEVHRLSQTEPRWQGMACVLTAAIVRDGRLVAGHVGDTRLYLFEDGRVQKITHDHSPVGEREDAGELSELEAMRHPRRNEIFRDVGSQPHNPADDEFVEIVECPFRDDSAILLCSDGLSDLVASPQIAGAVYGNAADPERLVARLVEAANAEGGKDNVTVVFAAGPRFADRARPYASVAHDPSRPLDVAATWTDAARKAAARRRVLLPWWMAALAGLAAGLIVGGGLTFLAVTQVDQATEWVVEANPPSRWSRTWTVGFEPGDDFQTIQEALTRAKAGDTVRVAPGEYRAPVEIGAGVSLVSAAPRGAILRPAVGAEPSAGVVAAGEGARVSGFRITGDAERPLAVGVRVHGTEAVVDDVEVAGAAESGVVFQERSSGVVRGCLLRENAGAAVVVRPGAVATLSNNVMSGNGKVPGKLKPAVELVETARASIVGNIIAGNGEDRVAGWPPSSHGDLARDNIVGLPAAASAPARRPGVPRREPVR